MSGISISSGIAAVDRYLAGGYLAVPGMSSRFAAAIACATLRIQSENGIAGHAAEIGTFEGRFFIALAHSLSDGEKMIGVDHFSWPDPGLRERLEQNCTQAGVRGDRLIVVHENSRKLRPRFMRSLAPNSSIRFFHIDGDHSPRALAHDLRLAAATLDPRGVICLDDMLHPRYPRLAIVVDEFLRAHNRMRVFCIVDREDIIAAAKFMICRDSEFKFYKSALANAFPQYVWPRGAEFVSFKRAGVRRLWMGGDIQTAGYHALVLAPDPKVPNVVGRTEPHDPAELRTPSTGTG